MEDELNGEKERNELYKKLKFQPKNHPEEYTKICFDFWLDKLDEWIEIMILHGTEPTCLTLQTMMYC